ncbi:MAG: peptide chain release factor N(5)-glutamine methyltransferase [Actinobacteria bacterium]|nr:peptide chain release factor N(5)-glutamine methyltransferase [Actinomycetota bacterium]
MHEAKQIWNVKRLLNWATNFFTAKNIAQPKLSAELLLASVLNYSRMQLYLHFDYVPGENELARFKEYILKRIQNIPVQYILKESYFRNLKLYVDESVLIHRPETELLVDKVLFTIIEYLKCFSDYRYLQEKGQKNILNILEIGTGSGAITISLASELDNFINNFAAKDIDFKSGFQWNILATEKSSEAILIARKNANKLISPENLSKIEFIECDILPDYNAGFNKNFLRNINIVVSNPPYIRENDYNKLPVEVLNYEPKQALLAGKTGLEVYNRILQKIKPYIFPGLCYIIFEIDPAISLSLKDLVINTLDGAVVTIEKDYNNRDRIMLIKI